MSTALRLEETVPASLVRHRLALGLSWIDAVTQTGANGRLSTTLESVGDYDINSAFERHRGDRFAQRYAGLLKKRLDKAVTDGLDTDFYVHVHAPDIAGRAAFDAATDARIYVPRRLRLALVLHNGQPAPTPQNIRTAWLWPGSAYPFPLTSTLIRASVRRGASLPASHPVRWARLFATIPETEAVFNQATIVGVGHGDDRGECVLQLDPRAVSGAALKNPLLVRLWAFAPAAGAPVDASDSFQGLPIENGGNAPLNDILRGRTVPPAYSAQQSKIIDLRLGETRGGPDTTFLFNP